MLWGLGGEADANLSTACWACLGGVREWAERIGRESMSVELISVLVAVLVMGVTLAGLILTSSRRAAAEHGLDG